VADGADEAPELDDPAVFCAKAGAAISAMAATADMRETRIILPPKMGMRVSNNVR
jgi:hypothetical protein